jgi:XTP/dITP diphosphohydrolase
VIHTVVFASQNRGKLREIRGLFEGLPVKIVMMEDVLRPLPVIVEDGATFADNARKKARIVSAATRSLTLADDSGLEVDILDGRPGVRSARFARERATDAENNAALVAALQATGDPSGLAGAEPFTARFRCALALFDPYAQHGDGEEVVAEGVCEGAITLAGRGSFGFGYDPLFVVAGRDKTMAELSDSEKNAVSHRAKASLALRPHLARLIVQRADVVRAVEEATVST